MDLLKIKQMTADGFAVRKIAAELNLKDQDVAHVIAENGFELEKTHFDAAAVDKIKELYQKGVSAKQLGIKYGIDKRRVQKWAREEGTLRDRNTSHRMVFFNEHIFDIIDSPEKAYWLGFLYADAYNYNDKRHFLRLSLKASDAPHLVKFCDFIGFNKNNIKFYEVENKDTGKIYPCARVTLNSIHLTDQLDKLGCVQGKSLIVTYPDWLSDDLHNHFIRGIYDGDGSLRSIASKDNTREWGWQIAGTKHVCEKIREIFNIKYNLPLSLIHIGATPDTNSWTVDSSGNLKIQSICEVLYRNATVYLDRKFERYQELAKFNLSRHPGMFNKYHFNDTIVIENKPLTKEYLLSLSAEEREQLIDPLVNRLQNMGFVYPDSLQAVNTEFSRLVKYQPDLNETTLDNNGRLATLICRYFCHSYYSTRSRDELSVYEAFHNENKLRNVLTIKLGLKDPSHITTLTMASLVAAFKEHRLCAQTSIFKPSIAKFICMKYSQEGDVVGDYSCGFGGRLLGAMSCGRKYAGTDPLTVPELQHMVEHFNWQNEVELVQLGSEFYKGKENSVDLYWSSPPYFDQELYSNALSQAYAKGEYYFYYVYWLKTLENIKHMLKPGKWFGINTSNKYTKLVELAQKYFGEVRDVIQLKSRRDHFQGQKDKVENIYMFVNNK